jgi:hypothetical protein
MSAGNGKAWRDDELGFVLSPPRGWTLEDIAAYLGRSIGSVTQKRNALRRGVATGTPYVTDEEWDDIRETAHLTAEAAAERLGLTYGQVATRRHRLRQDEGRVQVRPAAWRVGRKCTLLARTCDTCDELLDARHFERTSVGGWRHICNRCAHIRKGKPRRTSLNAAQAWWHAEEAVVKSLADRDGRPVYNVKRYQKWGPTELTELEGLRNSGLSVPERAAQLGRTARSVRMAHSRYRIPVDTPRFRQRWEIRFDGSAA